MRCCRRWGGQHRQQQHQNAQPGRGEAVPADLCANARAPLHAALQAVMPLLYTLPEARRVRWSLDVDPADLY